MGGCGQDNLVRGSLRADEPTVIPWRASSEAVVTRGKVSAAARRRQLKVRANPMGNHASSIRSECRSLEGSMMAGIPCHLICGKGVVIEGTVQSRITLHSSLYTKRGEHVAVGT